MSRKRKKNRDMLSEVKIGIFEGKGRKYNIIILETLLQQEPLTTWEIARHIWRKRNPLPDKDKDRIYGKTQKIYSVIQRKKGGRLPELEDKGYIEAHNGKWSLNLKGFLAILIKKPSLANDIHPCYLQAFKEKFDFPNTIEIPIIKVPIDGKELSAFFEKFFARLIKRKVFLMMAKGLEKLLQKGILDLDAVDEGTLTLFIARILYKNKQTHEILSQIVSSMDLHVD